jgi:hypothetical protein
MRMTSNRPQAFAGLEEPRYLFAFRFKSTANEIVGKPLSIVGTLHRLSRYDAPCRRRMISDAEH